MVEIKIIPEVFSYILAAKKGWKILLPQTQFGGPSITGAPVPATIALPLSNENEWIVAVKNNQLKMIKFRVTGTNTFDWISTKYVERPEAPCLTQESFSLSCFVGNAGNEKQYELQMVAEGIKMILCL